MTSLSANSVQLLLHDHELSKQTWHTDTVHLLKVLIYHITYCSVIALPSNQLPIVYEFIHPQNLIKAQ